MPKGVPNKRYSGGFKQEVIETMRREELSYREAEERFKITSHDRIPQWERIYLEEGPEGLYIERRGRGSKRRPPKLDKQVEEDLDCRESATACRGGLPKKLTSLGFGTRATAAESRRRF